MSESAPSPPDPLKLSLVKRIMNKLLEKAKSIDLKKKSGFSQYTHEEKLGLLKAWLEKEVSTTQVAKAIYGNARNSANVLYLFAVVLKIEYEKGNVKFK